VDSAFIVDVAMQYFSTCATDGSVWAAQGQVALPSASISGLPLTSVLSVAITNYGQTSVGSVATYHVPSANFCFFIFFYFFHFFFDWQ
jgi:hypothetical protein